MTVEHRLNSLGFLNKEKKLALALQTAKQRSLSLSGGVSDGGSQVGSQFGARDHIVLIEIGLSCDGF